MIRRTHTLVVFNTNSAAVTTDSTPRTSEYCADEYAYTRGYCSTRGQYWKLGADFGGIAAGPAYSTQPLYTVFRDLTVTSSYSPGMSPAVNNTRYYGQTLAVAIANMVADGELDAIFVESLVPNNDAWLYYPGYTYQGQCPSGRVMASAPFLAQYPLVLNQNSGYGRGGYGFSNTFKTIPNIKSNDWIKNNRTTQLPYGRIGYPGCTFADIQRIAADANWGESQNNLSKMHIVGGTNYQDGGDKYHMLKANQLFGNSITSGNLYYFDEATFNLSGSVGTQISYNDFDWGQQSPAHDVFGLLISRNPSPASPPTGIPLNVASWTAKRGAWAYDWGSAAIQVGYDCLQKGGTASILCENEPSSFGIPAVDCVAYALLKGLTMAEANFLSGMMSVSNCSVYGAPDYAPYALTNSISLEEDIDMSVQGLKLSWVSASAIDVGPGQAVVESLGYAVTVTSTIHKTGISLGNNAWGYVYLKDDGTIAISTTGPASTPFMATGKSKSGDTQQRFIGVIRTDGSGNIRPFEHDLSEGRFRYVNDNIGLGTTVFRVLANGNAMSSTAIDVRGVVPPESERVHLIVHNCSTNGGIVFVCNGHRSVSGSTFDFLALGATTGIVSLPCDVGCDATSANGLKYICDATGGSAYIDVHGFYIDR